MDAFTPQSWHTWPRGTATALAGPEPRIRIRPYRVVSWGFDGAGGGRSVGDASVT